MTKKQIDKAIAHTGLEIINNRDGICYFIDREGHQVGDSVYVPFYKDLSLDEWAEEAQLITY